MTYLVLYRNMYKYVIFVGAARPLKITIFIHIPI